MIVRLTIIADDRSIGKDNLFFSELDLSSLDTTIHAVQWYDTYGEVEYKPELVDGNLVRKQNEIIDSITPYQWAIDLWEEKKVEYDAAIAAALAAANTASANTSGE